MRRPSRSRRVALLAAAYCPACGTPNEPRMFFCKNCGASLALGDSTAHPEIPPAGPGAAAPPLYPGPTPAPGPLPTAPRLFYREAGFSTILGDTFVVFFRNWWAFWLPATAVALFANLGLILFFAAPEQAFSSSLSGPTLLSISMGNSIGLFILSLLLSLVAGSILQASLSYYAVRKHRRQEVRLASAFGRGIGKFLYVLVAAILLMVLLFVLGVAAGLLFIGSLIVAGIAGLCFGVMLLGLVIVGIIIIEVAVSLYVPIIVTEDAGPVDSLVRSWDLTKGHRWSLFATYIVLGIISFLLSVVVSFVLAPYLSPLLFVVLVAATSGFTNSIVLVAQSVGYSLLGPPARAEPANWAPLGSAR